MLLNCSCTTSIDNSLFEFTKRPRRSKADHDAHSHLLVWTYRERRVGLYATWAFLWVSQRQHHLTDLNSNNKTRTTQIAFFRFATPCGFFRGSKDEVQKVSLQGFMQKKILWNHCCENIVSRYQTLVSSFPREAVFRRRRPKAHFMTGRTGSSVTSKSV